MVAASSTNCTVSGCSRDGRLGGALGAGSLGCFACTCSSSSASSHPANTSVTTAMAMSTVNGRPRIPRSPPTWHVDTGGPHRHLPRGARDRARLAHVDPSHVYHSPVPSVLHKPRCLHVIFKAR